MDIWEESKDRDAYALFLEMGLGKSKINIDTLVWNYLNGTVDIAVIVALKGTYTNWKSTEEA